MLKLDIEEQEFFNDKTGEFFNVPEMHMKLEHSLISLKKWESKWHKPFLSQKDLSYDELRDYIRCMNISDNVAEENYKYIPAKYINEVVDYIKNPMTATWFSNNDKVGAAKSKKEVITNEIIYYWMITLNIPVEFQKWHLNQLLTLIKVVNIKNEPKKKMNRKDEARQRAALNKARQSKYHTKG
jgi:hypothetical protein